MNAIEPTQTIQLMDGDKVITIHVTDMSPAVQHMVATLDQWKQDELHEQRQLMKTRAAINDIKNTILSSLQQQVQ